MPETNSSEEASDVTVQGKTPEQAATDAATSPVSTAGLVEKVARFYHKAINHAQKVRTWLKRHQLDDEHVITQFLIGAANGKLIKALPSNEPQQGLQNIGILTAAGKEFFLDCATFPLLDADGGIVSLAGCPIAGGDDLLLPSASTALWNAPCVRHYAELLLATNLLDGLSLHKAGFPQSCAVVGSHLKPADLNLLHDAGVRRIIILCRKPGANLVQEQLSGFSTKLSPFHVNDFLVEKGTPALVVELDRIIAATPDAGFDGRIEPLGQGFAASFGRRRYEVCGIDKNARRLKITLKTERFGKLHVDTLDFYLAKSRKTLLQDLCCFFEEAPAVVDNDLTKLIKLCEQYSPETPATGGFSAGMSDQERQEAEAFGKAENLPELILQDFDTCGLIGEKPNKLLCYLAAVSRKTDDPISVLILSSSGAGKSTLQDTTLMLCPPEDVVKLTSLTGRALFYKGAKSLKHKILALEEEAGVRQAAYAIRNLISAGELIIETTVKDLGSGRLTTMQNRVEGPTTVFITTTNPDVDAEMRSRFFVTGVDESREQTRAILESQRKRQTLAGRNGQSTKEPVIRKHRNFQRLLRSVAVVNPYAEDLTYSDDRLQSRRDQPKYLNLIKAVAFLRQMQKPVKNRDGREYVEVNREDLRIADELAREILGKSLDDLNSVSRDLLLQIEKIVMERIDALSDSDKGTRLRRADIMFTRREIREYTGWPHTRVKRYIEQLVDMEYLVPESGRRGQLYTYRLMYDGQGRDGGRFVPGMNLATPGQGLVGGWSGVGHLPGTDQLVDNAIVKSEPDQNPTKG